MADGAGTSSARRRRERRLHSWAKHERMTVAIALAEALHHSAPKVRAEPYNAPQSQMTARAAGTRPGGLQDPEPQGRAVTVGNVAAPVPSLAGPLLAGAASEAVDSSSLRFLTAAALRKLKEEEMEKMVEKEEEVVEERSGSSSAAPVAPAESGYRMPRRTFDTLKRSCVDILRSPHEPSVAKAEARSRLALLLDRERRGGVG